jgi:hypothetical protein
MNQLKKLLNNYKEWKGGVTNILASSNGQDV